MTDPIEQRARELLAAAWEADGRHEGRGLAKMIRDGRTDGTVEMRAIAAALRSVEQPATTEESSTVQQPSAPAPVAWPKVEGIGRDVQSLRCLIVYLERNPSDTEMRALHDAIRTTPAPRSEDAPREAISAEAVREAWRAAITLGNNICVQESDRENASDGDVGWINGTAECAKRIRDYAEPAAAQLVEMLNEAGAHNALAAFSATDPREAAQEPGSVCAECLTAPQRREGSPLRPVTDEIDIEYPPLPRCWSGSPVTVTWAEDGEQTTREVYSSDQMHEYAIKAVESFRSRLAGESA